MRAKKNRHPSCIGFDKDVKEFLDTRKEGIADFLNKLVRAYKDKGTVTSEDMDMSEEIDQKIITEVSTEIAEGLLDVDQKVREFFRSEEYILYQATKTGKIIPPTKAALCRMKESLFYPPYCIDVSVEQIKPILVEMLTKFDVEDYRKRKGIRPDIISYEDEGKWQNT